MIKIYIHQGQGQFKIYLLELYKIMCDGYLTYLVKSFI